MAWCCMLRMHVWMSVSTDWLPPSRPSRSTTPPHAPFLPSLSQTSVNAMKIRQNKLGSANSSSKCIFMHIHTNKRARTYTHLAFMHTWQIYIYTLTRSVYGIAHHVRMIYHTDMRTGSSKIQWRTWPKKRRRAHIYTTENRGRVTKTYMHACMHTYIHAYIHIYTYENRRHDD